MRLILVRHGDAHAGFHGVIGGRDGLRRADAARPGAGRGAPRPPRSVGPGAGRRAARQRAAPCHRDGVDHRSRTRARDRRPGVRPVRGPHRRGRRPDLDRVRRPLRILRHGGRARPCVRAGRRELEQLPRAGAADARTGGTRPRGPDGRGRVPRRRDHGVPAGAPRHPPPRHRRRAPAGEHGPHRVGARPGRSTGGRCTRSTRPATSSASRRSADGAGRRLGSTASG